MFNEARRNVPSVIYIPTIEKWWSLVSETVRAIFLSSLSQLDPNIPILFLATADIQYKHLPEPVSTKRNTFYVYVKSNIFVLKVSSKVSIARKTKKF